MLPLLLFGVRSVLQLIQMAAGLHNQMLYALPLFRKAVRHGTVIRLTDDALYLIQIKTAETKLVIAQLLPELCFCFQPILPLVGVHSERIQRAVPILPDPDSAGKGCSAPE